MTYYLKYRPQTVSELDLEKVREILSKIINSSEIPHAFLFSGPKGSGKTSTARILAKAVNCLKPEKTGEPCNKCAECLSINKGSSMDVLEIDAASHRGVDDIRALRETIKFSPVGSKKKVYIIDEAHMLTTEAANALLKTLEEPPSHALFILATTAPEKLPDTIRSRCTTVPFYKGKPEEILRTLNKVVQGERLKVDKKTLQLIVAKSDGSFREAHKLLELLSLEGEEISFEKAVRIISGGELNPKNFLNFLAKKQAVEALLEIDELIQKGVNLRSFTIEAISILRKNLLNEFGVPQEVDEINELSVQDLQNLIELLNTAVSTMPTAVITQLPLELVVAKWVGDEKQKLSLKSNSEPESSEIKGKSSQDLLDKIERKGMELKISGILEEDKWKQIMLATKSKNHSVEALLRACRPAGFDGISLQIEVFYKFHKDRLETAGYRAIVEDAASEVLSKKPIRLICILSQDKKRAADLVNITVPDQEDVVKLAEEIFGATSDRKVH